MSGFFGRTLLAFQSFIALLGTIQSELSTTLKLSPRPSFTRIQLHVYILELLHSHFIKQQLQLDSKQNRRRRRTKRVEIFNKHCLFARSVGRYSRNRITSKYHYHASAYSLQTVCCGFVAVLFIYTKKTHKHCRHGQLEQTARMSWKSYDRRSSTANQRNSSGRFRGHPT